MAIWVAHCQDIIRKCAVFADVVVPAFLLEAKLIKADDVDVTGWDREYLPNLICCLADELAV
ncbi:hypothetical protein D3C85_1802020 [compost metagenome]